MTDNTRPQPTLSSALADELHALIVDFSEAMDGPEDFVPESSAEELAHLVLKHGGVIYSALRSQPTQSALTDELEQSPISCDGFSQGCSISFDLRDRILSALRSQTPQPSPSADLVDLEGHVADAVRDAILKTKGQVISFDDSSSIANLIVAQVSTLTTTQPSADVVEAKLGCDYCNNDGPLTRHEGHTPRCPRCDAEYPEKNTLSHDVEPVAWMCEVRLPVYNRVGAWRTVVSTTDPSSRKVRGYAVRNVQPLYIHPPDIAEKAARLVKQMISPGTVNRSACMKAIRELAEGEG